MKKVYIKTFGCRTNLFDTQVMLSNLENFVVTEQENEADAIVINSCTVTNGADSSVRGYVNQINKQQPHTKVFLTGCGAHTKGETLFDSEKVFGVFGQSEKKKIDQLLQAKDRFYELGDLNFIDDAVVEEFVGKSRAFIKVQEGCNFRCNYCIIPFVRGDARNLDEDLIVEQVSKLAINGFGEFILTGTNVGSYGSKAEGTSMPKLLKRLSQIRGVRRIRLGSIEPIQISDEFKEILQEPWMAKHLHVAIQHSHDDMLRHMNRRNRLKSDLELFEELSDAGYALGTDYIVGHPGESKEIWSEAYDNLKKFPLTHVHAFSYSKRDGTPSATMKPEISGDLAKERLKMVTSLVDSNNYEFRKKHKNDDLDILIESKKGDYYYGLDQYFNGVYVKSDQDLEGNWILKKADEIKQEGNFGSF
jgi:threonylcarbamoyladenosine tRNA methylthiotransferase MtaB